MCSVELGMKKFYNHVTADLMLTCQTRFYIISTKTSYERAEEKNELRLE